MLKFLSKKKGVFLKKFLKKKALTFPIIFLEFFNIYDKKINNFV